MSASQFASFTAYTAPPDEISTTITTSHTSNASHNAWFSHSHESSYQSGAVPTFSDPPRNKSTDLREEPPINQWETKSGYRVNLLAFSAYLFGPISALLLLIFETQNDYVRFHGEFNRSLLLLAKRALIPMSSLSIGSLDYTTGIHSDTVISHSVSILDKDSVYVDHRGYLIKC